MLDNKNMREVQMRNNKKGFSITEILIAVTLVLVLSAIAIPRLLGNQRQAEDASAKQQARLSVEVARSLLYEYGNFSQATAAKLKVDEPNIDWNTAASTPSGTSKAKIVSINVANSNTEFIAAVRGGTTDDVNYNCWFVKISKSGADKFAVEKRTDNNCIASTPPSAATFKDFDFPPAP
jgi:prepilin-type N-terminal cleavage/methylation domain-containing protein